MQLTRKIRVYPTEEQVKVLWTLSDRCRLLYNAALSEKRSAWETEQRDISYLEQQNKLPEIKKEYPEYGEVNSKVLQMAVRTMHANYGSFFALSKKDDTARPPGYRGKEYFFTMKYNQSGFTVDDKYVELNHYIPGGVKLKFDRREKIKFTDVKQVEVFLDNERWYLSVIDETKPPEYKDNGAHQAWDLGVTKQTGVNLKGKFIEVWNARPDKYWNKRIDAITGRRDHCKKRDRRKKNCAVSSKRWVQLNNIKRKFERKRSDQIRDFQHKSALMIVKNTRANTIVVGDLDVKSMPKSENANRGKNRSTQGNGYLGRFARFLTYKAKKVGKKTIKISERNTTKKCCSCGKFHDMPTEVRVMECDCGNRIDRDRNAAVNIMVRFLSQNAQWTGYQQFADNLRKTGLEIPVHSWEAPCASGV